MSQSPLHQALSVEALKQRVLPALQRKQFRIYRQKAVPFAYVSWAEVSVEVEHQLLDVERHIEIDEWSGGDRIVLVDLVAPFGGSEAVIRDVRERMFPGRDVTKIEAERQIAGCRQ